MLDWCQKYCSQNLGAAMLNWDKKRACTWSFSHLNNFEENLKLNLWAGIIIRIIYFLFGAADVFEFRQWWREWCLEFTKIVGEYFNNSVWNGPMWVSGRCISYYMPTFKDPDFSDHPIYRSLIILRDFKMLYHFEWFDTMLLFLYSLSTQNAFRARTSFFCIRKTIFSPKHMEITKDAFPKGGNGQPNIAVFVRLSVRKSFGHCPNCP